MPLKIVSWNVNGIRAVTKKGFFDWVQQESPDILCLQEIKAQPDQIAKEVASLLGYHAEWSCGERKGYSGVATFSRVPPVEVKKGFGIARFDREGRVIAHEFPDFALYNIYFPNGGSGEERLQYKLDFYGAFLDHIKSRQAGHHSVLVCGDFNTAHQPIDLARPKANEFTSGFLQVERDWLDRLHGHGFVDTFRHFTKDPGHYTWWDMKTGARERNVGWRIDYFYATPDLMPRVLSSTIKPEVMGSDHCPIVLHLG